MESKNMTLFTKSVNEFKYDKTKENPSFLLGHTEQNKPIYLSLDQIKNLIVLGGNSAPRKKLYESMFLSLLSHNEPEDLQIYPYDMYMREIHILSNMPHVVFKEESFRKAIDEISPQLKKRYELFRELGMVDLIEYNKKSEEKLPYILGVYNISSVTISNTLENKLLKLLNFGPTVGIHTIIICSDFKNSPLPKSLNHCFSSVITFVQKEEKTEEETDLSNNKYSLKERFELLSKTENNSIDEIVLKINGEKKKMILFNVAKDESISFINKIKKIETASVQTGITPLSPDDEEDYEMVKKCAYFVLSVRKASLSLLQREFALGFNRARKILNRLTELKILVQDDNSPYKKVVGTEELLDILFSKR